MFVDFLDEVLSVSQINQDSCVLYGALLSACQSGVGSRILLENRDKQGGIRSWCQLEQNMRQMAKEMSGSKDYKDL
jgi:hypothetical protein